MRHTLTFLLLFVLLNNISANPLKPGDKIPDIKINQLLNVPEGSIALEALKGKVIVIDFWATWCTPCIMGFPKMEALQKKFANEIQVIAVSDETPERINRFIKNRPVNFWMSADADALSQWFPHVAIPHVVIIDATGTVQAITNGYEVTEEVIAQVIKGKTPTVSYKDEKIKGGEAFAKVEDGKEFFGIKGYQAGISGGKSITPNSMMYTNFHFARFYLDMYNMSSSRLRYENIDKSEQAFTTENRYSLYIAIKENDQKKLLETLKQKLQQEFAYKTRIGKEKDTVYVISKIANPDTAWVKPANSPLIKHSINKGQFSAKNKSVGAAMADYLENFGIVDGIVLDETNDKTLYDINFTWEPEKQGAVDEFLKKLGLKLEKAVREYDVLIIYK